MWFSACVQASCSDTENTIYRRAEQFRRNYEYGGVWEILVRAAQTHVKPKIYGYDGEWDWVQHANDLAECSAFAGWLATTFTSSEIRLCLQCGADGTLRRNWTSYMFCFDLASPQAFVKIS